MAVGPGVLTARTLLRDEVPFPEPFDNFHHLCFDDRISGPENTVASLADFSEC